MEMRALHSRCGFLLARTRGLLASGFQPLMALTLAALLVVATASPQSPGSASARATLPGNKTAEATPPRPDKSRAQTAYQAGRRAEQAGAWKEAYAAYSEATAYAPADKEYSLLREHSRFQLVQGLADLAERQLLSGDIAGARQQLLHALEIDPNYAIARERLEQLPQDSPDLRQEKRPRLAGLPRLNPKPGTRDFDFRGATRSAYEELGRQFGVTVVFDGDLPDRVIRFRAPSVDFETALMVLSRQTRTFTRVVDDHTLFITEDSVQKVRDYAVEIEKNLVLPASVTSDDMNETVRMIREMTGISRTQLNTATRTLTVRSTEENVALAQALVEQIEQPHGEMMLEIEILQVDRDAAHQLGITPPESTTIFTLSPDQIFKLQQAQKNGTLLSVLESIFGSNSALGAAAGGLGAVLPPLIAFGGGKTIFLATVPGVGANFSQTLSAVRSARRVLLRAQDGKPATFFVGDRYPISLGVLSNSLATTSTSAVAAALLLGSLPHTDYKTGAAPVSVATGVFNGNNDQHLDLVTANHSDTVTSGTVSLLLGAGDGTFGAHTDFQVHVPQDANPSVPSAIAVGDFNGDNILDVAVTDFANNNVAILFGKGDGTFTPPTAAETFATGSGTNPVGHPVALLATDINGDGVLDLAVVNQGDGVTAGSVSILLGRVASNGKADGTFATPITYPVGIKPTAIASFDVSAGGGPGLVITNQVDNSVSVLLQDSTHTFSAKLDPATGKNPATGKGPAGIAVSDFNRDGHLDLTVTNQTDNTVSILLGSKNDDGTFGTHTDFAAGSGPVGIVAADFINAGTPQLVVADQAGSDLSLLIGNGDGTFASPVTLPSGAGPVALAAADLTGSGSLDLISANESANTVTVTLNTLQSSNPSSIPSSSTSPQTAYPSAEYVDLGLKVKATPRLHGEDEVTLHLEFDIRALAGSSVNGIPVLTNRTLDQTLRLRENQTSVLSGIVESSEARTISGLPWTATAPGAGYLTGNHTADTKDTETLFIITPRSLRLPPRNPRALYAGRGEPSTPPSPVAPPPGVPGPPVPPPGAQPISPGVPLQPPPPGGFPLSPPGRPQ
jgi:Flp pilus assembly secretin CpaC